jgi:hypothetical protein
MVIFNLKEEANSLTLIGLTKGDEYTYHKSLNDQLAQITDWTKFDKLGGEAYLFLKQFDSRVGCNPK